MLLWGFYPQRCQRKWAALEPRPGPLCFLQNLCALQGPKEVGPGAGAGGNGLEPPRQETEPKGTGRWGRGKPDRKSELGRLQRSQGQSHGSNFFFFFFFFNGCTCGIWRFPGQGSNQSCSRWPTPQPQWQIRAMSVTYSHSNAGSLTHLVRPGIEPATSWLPVRFVSAGPRRELLFFCFLWSHLWHMEVLRLGVKMEL